MGLHIGYKCKCQHNLVWCNRSSLDNKGAIDADTLLWFEQESGFLSFQKASE